MDGYKKNVHQKIKMLTNIMFIGEMLRNHLITHTEMHLHAYICNTHTYRYIQTHSTHTCKPIHSHIYIHTDILTHTFA